MPVRARLVLQSKNVKITSSDITADLIENNRNLSFQLEESEPYPWSRLLKRNCSRIADKLDIKRLQDWMGFQKNLSSWVLE